MATARADEKRDAVLELVAGRVSLARLTVPMANSALCPKPDGSPFASPVFIPVPGPPGTGGDPYEQNPEMDGAASPGTSDEYARGDHRHPTDTTRQAVIEDLASIRSGAAAGATAVQPSALSRYRTATEQDAIDGALDEAISAKYTKPATGIPASDLAAGVIPTVPSLPISIENGGTGATSKNAALANLGAVKKAGDTMTGTLTVTDGADGQTNVAAGSVRVNNGYSDTAYGAGAIVDPANGKTRILPASTGTLALQEGIAPAFSASSTYAVGDYVTREGLLYKCTTAVTTAGAWNAANWSAVAVTDEMGADTPLPFDAEVEYIECSGVTTYLDFYINSLYDLEVEAYLPNGTLSTDTVIFGRWTSSHSHLIAVRNSELIVYYGGTTNTSISNAVPTGSWFTMSLQGSVASCNGQTKTITRKYDTDGSSMMLISATNSARIRRARISYGAHDLMDLRPVRVGSTAYFYDCVRGILVGIDSGTATPGPDKATPTITTPGRIVELTDSPAFTGTPTAPTASAGTNTTQIATTAFVQTEARYALTAKTPSVSGTTATVACEDRAINDFTVATGITSLTITPPAAVTGRARDFFCRVTLTDASLPTVTLSGGTIDIGSSEVAGMTQGVNLLMFTEIASGHWLASRRSAS
jgi:hypothetical protein